MRSMSEIVQERLDAMGINPFEAARRAGLEKGFVNDLLIGRKQSIRRSSLEKLAVALGCDAEYLTGHQKTPVKHGETNADADETASVQFGGVIESGTWREGTAHQKPGDTVPTAPDRRFPAKAQTAFLVRGDAADRVDIADGMVVIGCAPDVFEDVARRIRDGDPVVVRRWRHDHSESETSIRVMSGNVLVSPDGNGTPVARDDRNAEVLAVVVMTLRIF